MLRHCLGVRLCACFILLDLLCSASARGDNFGAVTATGTWSNSATWRPGGVPSAADNVYIGGDYPGGAAAMGTVKLTQNQSASNVSLGNDNGSSGTIDLGNFNLIVGDNITIGASLSSTGSILRGNGSFTAN